MAVYQGVRLRPASLPARRVERGRIVPVDLARRARARPAGVIMGVTLGLTMLLLVYLTQTLGSNATEVELGSLAAQRQTLMRQLTNQAALVKIKSDPVEVARRADRAGLVQLDDAIILRAP